MCRNRWASVSSVFSCAFGLSKQAIYIFGFIGLSLFSHVPAAHAATYYVAGDVGSDSNTAVQAQNTATPWATIQKAADIMVAGDTVNVKGGIVYTGSNFCLLGNAVVCPANSGTSAVNQITYQAWSGTGIPIVDAIDQTGGFLIIGKTYIRIIGFEIKNASVNTKVGILNFTGSYLTIKNNIIRNNSSYGIYLNFSSNNTIINNTIYGNNTEIQGDGTCSNLTISNNVIYANNYGYSGTGLACAVADYNVYNSTYNSVTPGAHDISSDPLFTDPATGDFTLQPTSPAINAGADLSAAGVTTDILGRARPNAGAYDIGAYEDPNLYVAGDTGSDSNNGSMNSPFLTIQKGADVATAGDNVNVRGEITYAGQNACNSLAGEVAVVCIKVGGTSENYITYKAWSGTGVPRIQIQGTAGNGFTVLGNTKPFIIIEGFDISGYGNGSNPAGIQIPRLGNTNYVIRNNIFHDSYQGILLFLSGANIKIYNNTFYELNGNGFGSGAGIVIEDNSDADIKNNLFYSNDFGIESTDGVMTLDYNLFYDNTINYSGVSAGAHDLIVDPLLTDPSNGNFTMRSTSPARNAGVDLSASGVTTDILGVPRPQGLGYDIGALEYYDIPITLITTPATNTNTSSQIISGTASTVSGGSISSVEYSLDSGSWSTSGVSGTSSFTITIPSTFSDGSHTIRVRATDSYGNITDAFLYGSVSFTYDHTAPTVEWTDPSGTKKKYQSAGNDNVFMTELLPSFSFVTTQDAATRISKYQIFLNNEVYIDSINPTKPSGADIRDDADKYIRYDGDTIFVHAKKDDKKLTSGTSYKWKVRALDTAGNSTDTVEKILRINTHEANFSNTFFPFVVLSISGTPVDITSLHYDQIPSKLTINTATPTFYGITPLGTNVTLAITTTAGESVFTGSTIANDASRFGINVTETLPSGLYIVKLSAVNLYGDYIEFPDIMMTIGMIDR